MLLGDPRMRRCVLCQAGDPARLTVLLVPSRLGEGWFSVAPDQDIAAAISRACAAAPDYARPQNAAVLSREEAAALGLFTPNGRPRRTEVRELSRTKQQPSRCKHDTKSG